MPMDKVSFIPPAACHLESYTLGICPTASIGNSNAVVQSQLDHIYGMDCSRSLMQTRKIPID